MADEHDLFTAAAEVRASADPKFDPPAWFCRTAVVLQYLMQSWLALPLLASLQVPRGRAGLYDTTDFVLQLVALACSNERDIKGFYKASTSVRDALVALWSRRKRPARSTLCRFLQAIGETALMPLRAFLVDDLVAHGLPATKGLCTRTGSCLLVFDADGTRQAIRRRSVREGQDYPVAQRRAVASFAKGFRGRKRGEATRSRFVLMQAHTQEWLGGWLAPGNGQRLEMLDAALSAVAAYMLGRQQPIDQALVRLDGGHGWFADVQRIRNAGAHVLVRCVDYRLLKDALVQARLQRPADGICDTPDSPCRRSWWDVGTIAWKPNRTSLDAPMAIRLVATRRVLASTEDADASIGIRDGGFVWELFATSVLGEALTGADCLSLYAMRGAFEQVLAAEDREMELDKLVSGNLPGQSVWQLLGMLVWNITLRLGALAAPAEATARTTQWAEAAETRQCSEETDSVTPPLGGGVAPDPPSEESREGEHAGAKWRGEDAVTPAPSKDALDSQPTFDRQRDDWPVRRAQQQAGIAAGGEGQQVKGAAAAVDPGREARRRKAAERTRLRLQQEGFSVDEEKQLRCPEGHRVPHRGDMKHGRPSVHRFEMSGVVCRECVQRETCAKSPCLDGHGRRVMLPVLPALLWPDEALLSATAPLAIEPSLERAPNNAWRPARPGPRPVFWHDVAGSALRAEVGEKLDQQHVSVGWARGAADVALPQIQTRAGRAHARRTWAERRSKNSRRSTDPRLKIRLHGLPTALHPMVTAVSG